MERTLIVSGGPERRPAVQDPNYVSRWPDYALLRDATLQLVPADGAASHILWVEVPSPAHQLANPECCWEGPILPVVGKMASLTNADWANTFLLPSGLLIEVARKGEGLQHSSPLMRHASVIVSSVFLLALEKNEKLHYLDKTFRLKRIAYTITCLRDEETESQRYEDSCGGENQRRDFWIPARSTSHCNSQLPGSPWRAGRLPCLHLTCK